MEAATHSMLRESDVTAGSPSGPQALGSAPRLLTVTAIYQLSEEGRKASLLAGGDGRAQQHATLQVPTTRLHLVTVDANGQAKLKLRPRYELNAEQRVVRIDTTPTYDRPPAIEDLLRDAAHNHELERAHLADRTASRAKRREADLDFRAQIAQAFLGDRTQRALDHPAPSPKRCYLQTERGRVVFDARSDERPAKDVPAEAQRRFRADLAAHKERDRQVRAEQLALHEEKRRFVAEWIAQHGSPEQQVRQAAGVLPMDEAIEGITDGVLASLTDLRPYERDGAERLQAHLRTLPAHRNVTIAHDDLKIESSNSVTATAEQWTLIRRIQQLLPEARVTLRSHRIAWKRDEPTPALVQFGALVSLRYGPLVLRREFAAGPVSSEG